MRLYLIFILTVFASFMYAQTSLTDLKFNIYQNLNSSVIQNYIRLINESETGAGSQKAFEYDSWQKAEVVSKENETLQLDSVNYHINDETMFFMREGRMYFLYPDMINSVVFKDKVFIPFRSDLDPKTPVKYYEILVDGDLVLLKNKFIERQKVNDHPMGISSGIDTYREIEKYRFYYYYKENNKINEVPRQKKKFIYLFRRNKKSMIQYARDNDISTKVEADVVDMFEYYNEISQ